MIIGNPIGSTIIFRMDFDYIYIYIYIYIYNFGSRSNSSSKVSYIFSLTSKFGLFGFLNPRFLSFWFLIIILGPSNFIN